MPPDQRDEAPRPRLPELASETDAIAQAKLDEVKPLADALVAKGGAVIFLQIDPDINHLIKTSVTNVKGLSAAQVVNLMAWLQVTVRLTLDAVPIKKEQAAIFRRQVRDRARHLYRNRPR